MDAGAAKTPAVPDPPTHFCSVATACSLQVHLCAVDVICRENAQQVKSNI